MDTLMNFIIDQALIMIPFLWVIAEVIKRTEKIGNRWIPLILLALSLGFSPWLLGGYTAQNLVQAVLVAGGEMIAYQVVDKTVGNN